MIHVIYIFLIIGVKRFDISYNLQDNHPRNTGLIIYLV